MLLLILWFHVIFVEATKALGNDKFEGSKPEELFSLVSLIEERCSLMNCRQIFAVPHNNTMYNLLTRHGEIPLPTVQAVAGTRWATKSWDRQASYLLAVALLATLSSRLRRRVEQEKDKYFHATTQKPDVACLFKLICLYVMPSNWHTTELLVDKLKRLQPSDCSNNIVEFNVQFRDRLAAVLAAQDGGDAITDLKLYYNYLMRAYESVEHDTFRQLLSYLDLLPTKMPSMDLMRTAEDKYNTLVEEGKLNAASSNIEIMALKGRIKSTDKRIASNERKADSTEKKLQALMSKFTGGQKRKDSPQDKGGRNQKQKARGGRMSQAEFRKWRTTPPATGDEDKIVKLTDPRGKEKEWNWCRWHNCWVHAVSRGRPHNSNDCDLKDLTQEERDKLQAKRNQRQSVRQKKVQVKALQAEIEAAETALGSDDASSDGYSTASSTKDSVDK